MSDSRSTLFDVQARPDDLLAWIRYEHGPSKLSLRAPCKHVLLLAPRREHVLCLRGFSEDNGGRIQLVLHGKTALLSKPSDAKKLAENLALLITRTNRLG